MELCAQGVMYEALAFERTEGDECATMEAERESRRHD